MTGFLLLVLCAAFLVYVQRASRITPSFEGITISEAFVVGHWPFLYLNGVVLWVTGGTGWTSISLYDDAEILFSVLCIMFGLVFFLLGTKARGGANLKPKITPYSRWAALITAFIISVLGVYAAKFNLDIVHSYVGARDDRSNVMLAVSLLQVPGALFFYFAAFNRKFSIITRTLSFFSSVFVIYTITWGWSRTPLIVAILSAILGYFYLRTETISRKVFFGMAPVLMVIAVFMLSYRVAVMYSTSLQEVAAEGALNYYLSKIWLDSSAFSALISIVANYGPFGFDGGGSLISPFFVFFPRSYFPWKPDGFRLNEVIGEEYTIGPSVYGEILANLTVIGIPIIMFILGYIFRSLDIIFLKRRRHALFVVFYLILIVEAVFLVRGTVHAMVSPMVIQVVIPLVLYTILSTIFRLFLPSRR